MVQMAIQDNDRYIADDYEMKQEAWNAYTEQTLKHFKEVYPDDEIYFIMGADLLEDIGAGKWGNSEELVRDNRFIVMARNGIDMLKVISRSPLLRNHDDGQTFHLIDKGLAMEISSTYIRDELAVGGEPRYLLPESCYRYIKEHRIYG